MRWRQSIEGKRKNGKEKTEKRLNLRSGIEKRSTRAQERKKHKI